MTKVAPIEQARAAIEECGDKLRHAQFDAVGDKALQQAIKEALDGLNDYVMDPIGVLIRESREEDEREERAEWLNSVALMSPGKTGRI